MISLDRLNISELLAIADQAKVLCIMADRRTNHVTVDYVPPRAPIALPREPGDDDGLEVYPTSPIPITFILEDAMFGGLTYAALVCSGKVLIQPFFCNGYEALSQIAGQRAGNARG